MSIILTLEVLATWIAMALVLAPIGVAFLRRAGGLEPSRESLYLSVWSGLAIVVAALMVWHFFLPVGRAALVALCALSAACLLLERRWFAQFFAAGFTKIVKRGSDPIYLLLAVWVANHALGGPGMDDYTYELQAIRWIHDYPIVPGLANLHGRLGFNNSHHLLGALLASTPWHGGVNHVLNGFVVTLSLVYVVCAVGKLRDGVTPGRLFPALLLSPVAGLVLFGIFGSMIGTLKADVFISASVVFVAALFVRRDHPSLVVVLAALLATVKLSAVVFGGVILIAEAIRSEGRATWRAWTVASILLIGQVARGYVLSGYPFYPSTLGAAHVDWRVRASAANVERLGIRAWSQLRPDRDLASLDAWSWLGPWLRSVAATDRFTLILPTILIFVCAGALAAARRRPRMFAIALSAASLGAIAVWFTQAPAARFGAVYFWVLFAALGTEVALRAPRAAIVAFCVLLGCSQIIERAVSHTIHGRFGMLRDLAWLDIDDVREAPQVITPAMARPTDSGLIVYDVFDAHYDTPIPNTRFFNPRLELREPGNLRKGFRVADGR